MGSWRSALGVTKIDASGSQSVTCRAQSYVDRPGLPDTGTVRFWAAGWWGEGELGLGREGSGVDKRGWRDCLPRLMGKGDAAEAGAGRNGAPRPPAHLHLGPPAWRARLARLHHPQGPRGPATASLTRLGPAASLGLRAPPARGRIRLHPRFL